MTASTSRIAVWELDGVRRWVLAGVATGMSDALFATVLNTVMLQRGFTRVWLGVASVLLGTEALNGGTGMVLFGLAMHFTIALGWSAVFLFVVRRWHALRAIIDSHFGALKVAVAYGPIIWIVMDLVLIPSFTHRFPALNAVFFVLLVGHIPFVGLPIAFIIGNGAK